jgi:hypothetical protein
VDSYDDDMLDRAESLDSDEVRNEDGDEAVDPPDQWIDADDSESLDEKLAAETSDDPRDDWPSKDAHDSLVLQRGEMTSSCDYLRSAF